MPNPMIAENKRLRQTNAALSDKLVAREKQLARVTEELHDMAEHGLRFDLNPTHMLGNYSESERFWHEYIKRADVAIRERARAALDEQPEEGRVLVLREPKPGLICGNVAISTDPRYKGFVFARHADGVNWTTCARMTDEAWAMLDFAQSGDGQCLIDAQTLEELRRDAERYRYARKDPTMLLHLSNRDFDAAIDAAREEEI